MGNDAQTKTRALPNLSYTSLAENFVRGKYMIVGVLKDNTQYVSLICKKQGKRRISIKFQNWGVEDKLQRALFISGLQDYKEKTGDIVVYCSNSKELEKVLKCLSVVYENVKWVYDIDMYEKLFNENLYRKKLEAIHGHGWN